MKSPFFNAIVVGESSYRKIGQYLDFSLHPRARVDLDMIGREAIKILSCSVFGHF